jgi:EAL domain-containing protein (putative c-di-GMP-specific phosphodiesterase class I)
MRVIAEGVEDSGQLDYLREIGCNEVQGFYFSRPMPPGEMGELLHRAACEYRSKIDPSIETVEGQ